MENEEVKKVIKFKNPIIIGLLVLLIGVVIGIGSPYVLNKKTFEDAAAEIVTYTGNAKFDPQLGIVLEKENEDGTISRVEIEDFFEEISGIDTFLQDDEESTKEEKLEYLINAELVTKFPYNKALENDESKLNGVLRFYRYTNQMEAEEGQEDDLDREEIDLNQIDPSKIFYIGDSWMVALQYYIEHNISSEYPGDDYFLCQSGLGAQHEKFSNDNLKSHIDNVNAQAIVIMLGLNDRSSEAANRMKEITDFLTTTYPDKTIYVLKVPHVGEAYRYNEYLGAVEMNHQIDSYNPLLLENCKDQANVKFIDVTSNMMTSELYLDTRYVADDGLHLNNTGLDLWYKNIKECIAEGKSSVDLQKFQMIYLTEEQFDQKFNECKNAGDKSIFQYFTINEDDEVVIATWSQTTRNVRTDDPEVTAESLSSETYTYSVVEEGVYSAGNYRMNKTSLISYHTLVENYSMPFNLLWAFLVQTRDYNFVKEIADMAYESKICIGIYDNQNITVSNNSETYNKRLRFTENTELIFPGVGQTEPSFNISDARYEDVVRYCQSEIHQDRKIHYSNVDTGVTETGIPQAIDRFVREDGRLTYLYITGVQSDGTVTEVATDQSQGEFTKSTHITTVNATNPSIGVFLADTWIARWDATYKMEVGEVKQDSGGGEQGDEEYESLPKEKIAYALLGESGLIGNRLKIHSDNLKQEAIDEIVEHTSFSVTIPITWQKVTDHIQDCDTCLMEIRTAYGKTWDELLVELTKREIGEDILDNKNYSGTDAKLKAKKRIYLDVYNKNRQAEQAASNNKRTAFIQELNNEITYNQYPTAQRAKVNIRYQTSYSKTPYSYEKDEITVKNEAKKFKEILNDGAYHETKRAILNREEWFWEYIRSAEDTAKLEDVIRVMLNIAFDTDDFGTFTQEEIDRIFKAFEPKFKNKSGGGHLNAFSQWLKSYENNALREYMNADGMPYSYVENYVTEDREYGKMYFTEFDGCWNFTYGIMVCNRNGGLNNVGIFEQYGYDLESMVNDAKAGRTVTVPMETLEQIYMDLVRGKYNSLKTIIETHDVKMETHQYYGLLNFCYQWGNCGQYISGEDNIAEVYKKYYIEENNPEEFKNNAQCQTGDGGRAYFWLAQYKTRQEAAWTLFHEGRYILSTGEELFPSGSGDYPEGIRVIQSGDYFFPEYPQSARVGSQWVLYKDRQYGIFYPDKTLASSGCGTYSMACIVSGLLGDASIDPVTYVDNLDEYFPDGSYYEYNQGSNSKVYDNGFLEKYYGVHSRVCTSESEMLRIFEEMDGNCAAIGYEEGHFLSIIPIMDGTSKFYVIDSARGHTGEYESGSDFINSTTATKFGVSAIIYP